MSDISVMSLPFNSVILIKESSTSLFESKTFSVLLGVIIAFILKMIDDYRRERVDLDRYEYTILIKTKNILENNSTNVRYINAFMLQLLRDLRFVKLESSKLIFNSLIKVAQGSNDLEKEKEEIKTRLDYLKLGFISKIESKFKSLIHISSQ
jgi:hypothetical protein